MNLPPTECTNEPQNDFLALEKVIYRISKGNDAQSFPYMVYVLPVTDYGKERYIYLNYFQLQSEVSAVFNAV